MANVEDVRPKIWDENSILDLYDDGEYSAIWGIREDDSYRSLGVRWNGDDSYMGYPNQGKNPVWYSEPQMMWQPILNKLLEQVKTNCNHPRKDEFLANILKALEEC